MTVIVAKCSPVDHFETSGKLAPLHATPPLKMPRQRIPWHSEPSQSENVGHAEPKRLQHLQNRIPTPDTQRKKRVPGSQLTTQI